MKYTIEGMHIEDGIDTDIVTITVGRAEVTLNTLQLNQLIRTLHSIKRDRLPTAASDTSYTTHTIDDQGMRHKAIAGPVKGLGTRFERPAPCADGEDVARGLIKRIKLGDRS